MGVSANCVMPTMCRLLQKLQLQRANYSGCVQNTFCSLMTVSARSFVVEHASTTQLRTSSVVNWPSVRFHLCYASRWRATCTHSATGGFSLRIYLLPEVTINLVPFEHWRVQRTRDGRTKWERAFSTTDGGLTARVESSFSGAQLPAFFCDEVELDEPKFLQLQVEGRLHVAEREEANASSAVKQLQKHHCRKCKQDLPGSFFSRKMLTRPPHVRSCLDCLPHIGALRHADSWLEDDF